MGEMVYMDFSDKILVLTVETKMLSMKFRILVSQIWYKGNTGQGQEVSPVIKKIQIRMLSFNFLYYKNGDRKGT